MITNQLRLALVATSICITATIAGAIPVVAQQSPPASLDKNAIVLVPGLMTGPGTMGPRGYKRFCTPRSIGLYEWQIRWVEQIVKATEAQKAAMTDLQAASATALAAISAACKAETAPATTIAQLEMVDRRLDAMSQAVKTLRPAFEAFYASLDNQQK
jgi:LTXXQ motif family protein